MFCLVTMKGRVIGKVLLGRGKANPKIDRCKKIFSSIRIHPLPSFFVCLLSLSVRLSWRNGKFRNEGRLLGLFFCSLCVEGYDSALQLLVGKGTDLLVAFLLIWYPSPLFLFLLLLLLLLLLFFVVLLHCCSSVFCSVLYTSPANSH